MNPNCKKRMGVIRLETMKVVSQKEIAPAIFELLLQVKEEHQSRHQLREHDYAALNQINQNHSPEVP